MQHPNLAVIIMTKVKIIICVVVVVVMMMMITWLPSWKTFSFKRTFESHKNKLSLNTLG